MLSFFFIFDGVTVKIENNQDSVTQTKADDFCQ